MADDKSFEERVAALEVLFTQLTEAGATETMGDDKSVEERVAALEVGFELLAKAPPTEFLANAGPTEWILHHGFNRVSDRLQSIAAQLAPLRVLSPKPGLIKSDQQALLQRLDAALRPPGPDVKPTPSAAGSVVPAQKRRAP